MKGFVSTPAATVDLMVSLLFRGRRPTANTTVLDPGCGTGEFICGILRWCEARGSRVPIIVGVESHRGRALEAIAKFRTHPQVEVRQEDFLRDNPAQYDFVIGNPPYVPITSLNAREKACYRSKFLTAKGRFDLYLLFFERALASLKPGGRLVFITPEKFLYVEAATALRQLLARVQVEDIRLLEEATFGELVTYPTVTSVLNDSPKRPTRITLRTGIFQIEKPENSGLNFRDTLDTSPARSTMWGADVELPCSAGNTGAKTGLKHCRGRPSDG